jgi:hypothetical protein
MGKAHGGVKTPRNEKDARIPMMDTQIFKLNLSVHAVSLYILVAELASLGIRPTSEEIMARFNATEKASQDALEELLRHEVLYENVLGDGLKSYHPNPASLWIMPPPKPKNGT